VAFPANSGGVCRKRQFSLSLEPAYSGLQDYVADGILPVDWCGDMADLPTVSE